MTFTHTLVAAVLLAPLAAACARDYDVDALRGTVQGRVCDQAGEGLVNAPLSLAMANGGALTGTTGADGNFTFGRVAYGPATLSFDERTLEVDVAPAEISVVTDTACRPEPAAPGTGGVTGVVCNRHTGEYLVEADVLVSLATGELFATDTDGAGGFLLQNVPVGDHVLTIEAPGYNQAYAIAIRAGAITVLDVGTDCDGPELTEAPVPEETPPEETPPEEPPPPPPPPPPACVPTEEIAGNGVDEDCDGADAVCTPIEVNVQLSGDCVTTQCPADAPYPVGCDIQMEGGDGRGCVANTPGQSVVYFQEGDVCGAGHVEGTLLCSALLCADGAGFIELDAGNCPINKSQPMYPDNRDGCPDT